MPTKVRLVKAMVFPVVMYGYESWITKVYKQMLERVWRIGNILTLLVGMQTDKATMENSMEIPYKLGISHHMTQESHY